MITSEANGQQYTEGKAIPSLFSIEPGTSLAVYL